MSIVLKNKQYSYQILEESRHWERYLETEDLEQLCQHQEAGRLVDPGEILEAE